jgi:hypothetical protein
MNLDVYERAINKVLESELFAQEREIILNSDGSTTELAISARKACDSNRLITTILIAKPLVASSAKKRRTVTHALWADLHKMGECRNKQFTVHDGVKYVLWVVEEPPRSSHPHAPSLSTDLHHL